MRKTSQLIRTVKGKRKDLGLTQKEFSLRVGIGLRFLRSLEQGKTNLQLNKVIQVLNYLGLTVGAIPKEEDLKN